MERVAEVLQAPNPIKVDPIPVPLHQFTDKITFDQVSFRYPRAESDAVHRVSFTLHKGEIVALLGASGAGKSTVADLLPRFHDVTAGRILIDGTDIRDCPPRALRQLMGIVGQDPILFHDTVFNNIALGMEDAEENDVKAAAMAAHAHEFIEAMPLGYHTQVGDRGVKLSGGQRQRLTIARAILKNPPILILDEATSALDSESEKLVQEALNRLLTNRTALIIAHRLSTIRQADKILVMENGEIVESGNHQSLMKKNGIYRKLVELQKLA
jgi:subfamily B ATP-binding cassette protein MsbA